VAAYGPIQRRPAYRAGVWWTGTKTSTGSRSSTTSAPTASRTRTTRASSTTTPTAGETNFDQTDLTESDQIGLTGFKYNKIKAGQGAGARDTDGVLFYTETQGWPEKLYRKFASPDSADRASTRRSSTTTTSDSCSRPGRSSSRSDRPSRFSLALAYGGDLDELRGTVHTVQQIYNSNYQFAVPPTRPIVTAEVGDRS
jgi:hypothetical protein